MTTTTYTYNIGTLIGQTRLYAADTNVAVDGGCASFSDEEIQYYLTVNSNIPMLAAANMLEALASDAARVAIVIRTQSLEVDRESLSATYLKMAKELRAKCVFTPTVNPPDQIFSTGSNNGSISGTMDLW